MPSFIDYEKYFAKDFEPVWNEEKLIYKQVNLTLPSGGFFFYAIGDNLNQLYSFAISKITWIPLGQN